MSAAILFARASRLVVLAIFVALLATLFRSSSAVVAAPPDSPETPILAWAGQRVVIEQYWGDAAGVCPDFDGGTGNPDQFGVLYQLDSGKGGFTSLSGNPNASELEAGHALMVVNRSALDANSDGRTDPNSACISRTVYESEDQGKVEVSARAVDDSDTIAAFHTRSPDVHFVIYFMKLEDVTLGLVPGSRSGANAGDFTPATAPMSDPSNDVTTTTSNSSSDVLARARVRGWVLDAGCPIRPAGLDSGGAFLPADRCVFPDDWEFIAGGPSAEATRPDFDIMKAPDSPFLTNTAGCQSPDRAAGPFSRLDRAPVDLSPVTPSGLCGDSLAPHVGTGFACHFGAGSCRESALPDGNVDSSDAPMPPSLLHLTLTGAGFMKGADKASVYTGNSNPFYVTHIPAEPWITPINADGEGYSWNTWGTGPHSGLYRFWSSLTDHGPEVMSCPGASPCPGDETPTGGYAAINIYSDNHGEAMAWVNGDANLISGRSLLTAVVDYPDKRKHFALQSSAVDINWTVQVSPPDSGTLPPPVTVTFTTVITPGVTTLQLGATGPARPAGFTLGDPPVYYDISTTATFSGPVTICIDYTGIAFVDEASITLNHYAGGVWTDVTSSRDNVNNIICGSVTSFSPFTLFEPAAVGGTAELLTSSANGGRSSTWLLLLFAAAAILLSGGTAVYGLRKR